MHVDANVLVALVGGITTPLGPLRTYLQKEKDPGLAVSSVAWFEFLCGPSTGSLSDEEVDIAGTFVGGRILPADGRVAALAASLYNHVGRKKGIQADCLIAATAISLGAALFTLNSEDFVRFETFGLRLVR